MSDKLIELIIVLTLSSLVQEFSCFVDDDSVDLDVDISALTFNAKVSGGRST